jgi:type II secretory pathway component GspD/PulD (secretin)
MVRPFILIALLAFCRPAFAEKVNILFNDISVVEFSYFVLTELKKESFLMDNDFLQIDKRVTARFNDVEANEVFHQLKRMLADVGYAVTSRAGFHTISRARPEDEEVFVYFPKHRGAEYLRELAGTVIDPAGFSTSRSVPGAEGINPVAGEPSVNDRITRRIGDALVYRGSLLDVERLEKLLGQVDRPSAEVLVKAVIYEVRKESSKNNAISVALGLLDSAKGLGLSIATGTIDTSSSIRLRLSNVDAAWSILSKDARFKVVSAPTVRIRSGEKARFQAGAEVPTLGSTTYTGQGQPIQSVEYRSSGVILDLKPEIHEDDIILSITHQLSSFQQTQNGVNNSPTLLMRELQTSVSVQDDELVILGGLDEKRETNAKKGVSFLPEFLTGRQEEEEGTEILLLLHVKRI